jgi:antitoxin PrlF
VVAKTRARLRHKGQVTLPSEVRAALHVAEGDEIEFTVTESGEVMLHGLTPVPADQRWFWTEQWQTGEREAAGQIAAGQTTVYEDAEAMFADLDG